MQSLAPGWILLSQRPPAVFDLPQGQVVRTFAAAARRLQRGGVIGLMVDADFCEAPGGAWSTAFATRERFPAIPVAVLQGGPSPRIRKSK